MKKMKKVKKLFAVILAMLILMSSLSVSSFALPGIFKKYSPESVAFTNNRSVSLREMKEYFDEALEFADELPDEFLQQYMYFDLGASGADYAMEVKLDDGSAVSISADDYYKAIDDFNSVLVNAYISYDEYLRVADGKSKTVNVTVEVSVIGLFAGEEVAPKVFTLERNLKSCLVKSIKEISGVPSEIYEYSDYYLIDGSKFRVTFVNGTTKDYKVSLKFDEENYAVYEMNGEELIVWDYDGIMYIQYLDGIYEKKVTYKDVPVKKIAITDCKLDSSTMAVESVSYKITWKDGTKKTYTYEANGEYSDSYYTVIDKFDGLFVYLALSAFDYDYETEKLNLETCNVEVSIGSYEELIDNYELPNPYAETLAPLAGIINFIYKVYSVLQDIMIFDFI